MKATVKRLLITACLVCFAIVMGNTAKVEAAKKYTVTFIYGTNVNTQQVRAGRNAVVPTNVDVPGFIFAGWTDTAANIQSDKVILGMYVPNGIQPSASKLPTNNPIGGKAIKANNAISAPGCDWWDYSLKGEPGKTCVVRWYNGHNGELWKTEVVPYGTTLDDPGNPCMDHMDFIGWVGSWENITEDRNIMAWYMHTNKVQYTDKDGNIYATFWTHDQQKASDPYTPAAPEGYKFAGWGEGQKNVTDDRILHPIFEPIQ